MKGFGKSKEAHTPPPAETPPAPTAAIEGVRWLKRHGSNPVLQFQIGGLWVDVPTVKEGE